METHERQCTVPSKQQAEARRPRRQIRVSSLSRYPLVTYVARGELLLMLYVRPATRGRESTVTLGTPRLTINAFGVEHYHNNKIIIIYHNTGIIIKVVCIMMFAYTHASESKQDA